jgi:hypothetical protein
MMDGVWIADEVWLCGWSVGVGMMGYQEILSFFLHFTFYFFMYYQRHKLKIM